MEVRVPGARLIVDRLPEAGASARITGEEVAHAHARRLRTGDPVVLVDGTGREAEGRVTRETPRELEIRVDTVREATLDRLPPLALCVSAVRAQRLSWIAEKAAELGASRVTLVSSERTQAFRASDPVRTRLERLVREAAKQGGLARWPTITGPSPLDEMLRAEPSEQRLVLDSRGETFPAILPARSTALLVGPEGGWSDAELQTALSAGWTAVSLASGILKAETAAVSALALTRAAITRGLER